jgi:hypothetical protein
MDPPPVNVGKTLYVDRKIRLQLNSGATELKTLTIPSDQLIGSGAFKILKVAVWNLGGQTCSATLGKAVWNNSQEIKYLDVAPPSRLPGIQFNIPDQLAAVLDRTSETDSVILSGLQEGSKIIDLTLRLQI